MIRDITLGQYYPGDSILHRLDPRIKILATLAYIILLFIVNEWIGFAACFVFLAAEVALSKVPLSYILRGLKVIFLVILFMVFFPQAVLWLPNLVYGVAA